MVSELAARKHISSCPRNPFLQQSMKKTALVKKKLLATMLSNNALSPVSDESVPEARNETVELSEKEDSVKEDVKVTNGAKMAEEELSAVKQNIGIAETILMKGITEVINDVEETAEKNCGESASDDCVIVETKPVDDPLMVEVEIVPAATNGNLKMMEREILDNESKLEDIQSAIEKNNKEIFSELTVLVCNRCVFNSRSTLKMAVHCASHLVTSEKTVDYVSGYRTVYYCVNCVKAFRTAGFLRCHVDRCPRVDEKVFLLKIGKVMHCTKCYFDSDDTKIVLQHLLNCGNIKIGNAER